MSVVEVVLPYLQEKPLLSCILLQYPELGWSIPSRYERSCGIQHRLLTQTQQGAQKSLKSIFYGACSSGYDVALENLLSIQFVHPLDECNDFLTSRESFEVPAIRGALRPEIRFDSEIHVAAFVRYDSMRGLKMLRLPDFSLNTIILRGES